MKLLIKFIPKSLRYLARKYLKKFMLNYIDNKTRLFIRHNNKYWKNYSKYDSEAEILLEGTKMQSSILSNSYTANILAKKYNARIKVYSFGENNAIKRSQQKIYGSFNAEIL